MIVAIAAAVKFPAAVAMPFLPLLWSGRPDDRRLGVSAPDAACPGPTHRGGGRCRRPDVLADQRGDGLDLGWWHQATGGTDSPVALTGLIVALAALWWHGVQRGAAPALAGCLLAMVLLGPPVMTWYWLWPLLLGALVLTARTAVVAVAVGSLALVIQVQPDGSSAHLQLLACVALAALAAIPTLEHAKASAPARDPWPLPNP